MNKRFFPFTTRSRSLAIYGLLALAVPYAANGQELSAEAIIDRYVNTLEADSELAYIRMKTYIPGGLNSIVKEHRFLALMQQNENGQRSYMIRMIRPLTVEGVTVLAVETEDGKTEQYSYLPDIGYVTRIGADNRSGAFLGSDFTYEDLVREVPGNFRYERRPDQIVHGVDCYTVRARPEGTANTSNYAYRDLYLDKGNFTLIKIDFYATGDRIAKSFDAYDYNSSEVAGETLRPHHAVMTNVEKKTTTVMNVVEGRLNIDLDAELFTPERIVDLTPDDVRELIFTQGFTVTE